MTPTKNYFISFSFADVELARFVGRTLEDAGYSVDIAVRDFHPGNDIIVEMDRAISRCERTIALLSPRYLSSPFTRLEWAAALMVDPDGSKRKLLLIRIAPCDPEGLLKGRIFVDFVGVSAEERKRRLLNACCDDLPIRHDLAGTRSLLDEYYSESWPESRAQFGRDIDLDRLDSALSDGRARVIVIVGMGGQGKTALLNSFVNDRVRPNKRMNFVKLFAWSFYSQGATPGEQSDAYAFIKRSLIFFGDAEMANSLASPWDKGTRLGHLLRQQKSLLLLDGLEPLQDEDGRIKDRAVRAFLLTAARGSSSVTVITSRLEVEELKTFPECALKIEVKRMPREASVEYLEFMKVVGPDQDLARIADEFDNHALALTLLGNLLRVQYQGKLGSMKAMPVLAAERIYGGHARRVMRWYEDLCQGKPELQILLFLGLFDRRVEESLIDMIREADVIPGLNDLLKSSTAVELSYAVERLLRLEIITITVLDTGEKAIELHPLVRQHYGEKLRSENPTAWIAGNRRLHKYFRDLPSCERPDGLPELEYLYRSVGHACAAKLYSAALELYRNRILRGDESFSWRTYGNFAMELVALSKFFLELWQRLPDDLNYQEKGFLLGQVGFHLMAQARLDEALGPMQESLVSFEAADDHEKIALSGCNLSKLYLATGELTKARDCAKRCLSIALRATEYARLGLKAALAAALHYCGRISDSERLFVEAETTQHSIDGRFPLLYAFRGFRYCDLLLDQWRLDMVQRHVDQTLVAIKTETISTFGKGIFYLLWAKLQAVRFERGDADALATFQTYIADAMKYLRDAGQQMHIISALLVRAEIGRLTSAYQTAESDTERALEIAVAGGMKRYECDARIERARLLLTELESVGVGVTILTEAKEQLTKAVDFVLKAGYKRRVPEVLMEFARLKRLEGDELGAGLNLEVAESLIDTIGFPRWRHYLERLKGDSLSRSPVV